MLKRVVTLLLVVMMVLSLTACGSKEEEGVIVDKIALEEVKAGLEKLRGTDKYLISNSLRAPDGNANYLEVVKKDCSYTEYPVNSDGTLLTDSNSINESTSYNLSDWLETDGNMYINQPSSSNSEDTKKDKDKSEIIAENFHKMPKSYANLCQGRRLMYLDKIIPALTSLKKKETQKRNFSDGEVNLTTYEGKIPSSTVREVLGVGTKGLYESIIKDYEKETNIKKLCNQYLDNLKMDLTFSDAIITLGVADGMIREVTIETGGLGTRLYVTKTALPYLRFTEREKPDFSKCNDYIDSMREVADYVAKYDSYEEAMEALDNGSAVSGSAVK